MEILSDSVFRGNVKLANSKLRIVGKEDSDDAGMTIDSSEICFGDRTRLTFSTNTLWLSGPPGLSHNATIMSMVIATSEFNIDPKTLVFTSTSNSPTYYAYFEESQFASTDPSRVIVLRKDIESIKPTKNIFGNPYLPQGCTVFFFVDNYQPYDGCSMNENNPVFIVANKTHNVSMMQVINGGTSGHSKEVQIDVEQLSGFSSGGNPLSLPEGQRLFRATLSSNPNGYNPTEFLLLFDEYAGPGGDITSGDIIVCASNS